MGSMESLQPNQKVTRHLFNFKYIIGRGGFGKVWNVTYKKTNTAYALKEMSKMKIIDKKSEQGIIAEKVFLASMHHPYIVNMIYSFQDSDYLYLVMDLMTGGDLRYHIGKNKRFNEEQTKFFLACILLGLEYIHECGIIHRDIKPENMVLDEKGYVRITDFGIAKRFSLENEYDNSGTPGYMAPEVLCSQNSSYPVDYFALGVIGYEFMLGTRPYHGKTKREIKQNIIATQVKIKANEIPVGWSYEAADLFNSLIQRKSPLRLGYNGIAEIKTHPWFNTINWNDLYEKKILSPFIPKKRDNFDRRYCTAEEKIGLDTQERYRQFRSNENYESIFKEYTHNNIPSEDIKLISSNLSTISTKSSPGESRFAFNSPLKFKASSPLQASFLSNKKLLLGKSPTFKRNESTKDSLPMINPNNRSMQKSCSSMSIYKTNKSMIKPFNLHKLNLQKASPIMMVRDMANKSLLQHSILRGRNCDKDKDI